MVDRPVLVHYHIFKNAGTSVDVALERSFGARWTTFEGSDWRDVQTAEQLGRFLRDRPEVRAVSSHLARPPLPFPGCRPIVFLRHPLLRARSAYEFIRRHPEQPGCPPDQRQTFSMFVRWALEGDRMDGTGVISECQLEHLIEPPAEPRTSPPTVEHLRDAKARVESWGIIGIVEDYKASARRFQARYAAEFPELDFVDVRANRTSTGIPDIESGTRAIREELGNELFDRLVEVNRLDLELYDWAVRRFGNERPGRAAPRRSAAELADENEKLRDEVRYLTSEWETFDARSREIAAQYDAIVAVRDREIAEHEALACSHNELNARHAALVEVRNLEIAEHAALARAHVELNARHAALVEVRDGEIAEHAALARAHDELNARLAALVEVRNGEVAEHAALARAHDDVNARHAALVEIRDGEIAAHAALAHAHNDLVARYEKLVQIRDREITDHEELAAVYHPLVAERDALARERDAMRASHSWRLTAPLRWLRNLFVGRPG